MVLLPKGINSFGLPIRLDSPAARTTAEIMPAMPLLFAGNTAERY
jgi:hypothetical protein